MQPDIPDTTSPFTDAAAVARYAEGPPRIVPGFADMHRMTALLLGERVPDTGRVLVMGAGGGLELKAFAQAHPGWTFDGVDPSKEMLRLAEQTLGPLASRVRLHEGGILQAPDGPFHGATCLLTQHFLRLDDRQGMLAGIRKRLVPGAPFIQVHLSLPKEEPARTKWLARYAAYATGAAAGSPPSENQSAMAATVAARLSILSPEEDEALLREAGFSDVSLFYAGFAFRGWVAYA
jgi:tRNA (cmo5U34)-methyltransferase